MKVGIDLGTTNSAVAYITADGQAEIIPNAEGGRMTPSVLLFEEGNVVVGEIAKQNSVYDPLNVAQFVKRQMGNKGYNYIAEDDKVYTAEELSAFILKKLIQDAEAFLGEKVTEVVVTVPAYFDDAKRQSTKDAGRLIGLNIVKIINEPTAAALSFAHSGKGTLGNILVYDLGGGTFDATLMTLSEDNIDILSTSGDKNLGGFDFDNLIINHVIKKFEEEYDLDLFDDEEAMQHLREKAEVVKQQLSSKQSAPLIIGVFGKKLKVDFTRDLFSQMLRPLLERSLNIMDIVMESANMAYKQLDSILLVGGSSRIPLIESLIIEHTGIKPSKNLHFDEAIAIGAAWQCEYLDTNEVDRSKKKMEISDVTSHSIGIVVADNDIEQNCILLPQNSKIPISKKQEFYLVYDDQTQLNIRVTEGEDIDLEYVRIIGETMVELPEGVKAGDGVVFDICLDENQIVHVFAYLSHRNQYLGEIHLERASNLTEDEVNKMCQSLSNTKVN